MQVELNDGKMALASEALERAWKLIDRPWKWCQGATARDGYTGRRFCSHGALLEIVPDRLDNHALEHFLKKAAFSLVCVDGDTSYIAFNDNHWWFAVRRMWMRAIALARREERNDFLDKLLAPLPEELDHVDSEQTVSAEDAERDLVSAL